MERKAPGQHTDISIQQPAPHPGHSRSRYLPERPRADIQCTQSLHGRITRSELAPRGRVLVVKLAFALRVTYHAVRKLATVPTTVHY